MIGKGRPAVFLDRDGILNRAIVKDRRPFPPTALEDLEIVPDAPGSVEDLKAAGFVLVGITNQPDVARGTLRREVVEAINTVLLRSMPLRDILVCYHDDEDGCQCRKPQPGLMVEAAARFGLDLPSSFVIGDRWKDVEAGRRAGCRTVLVDYGYSEEGPSHPPDHTVRSVRDAVDWIIGQSRGGIP